MQRRTEAANPNSCEEEVFLPSAFGLSIVRIIVPAQTLPLHNSTKNRYSVVACTTLAPLMSNSSYFESSRSTEQLFDLVLGTSSIQSCSYNLRITTIS